MLLSIIHIKFRLYTKTVFLSRMIWHHIDIPAYKSCKVFEFLNLITILYYGSRLFEFFII